MDATLAVKGILTVLPLQTVAVLALVTVGVVLEPTVIVFIITPQPEEASLTCTV